MHSLYYGIIIMLLTCEECLSHGVASVYWLAALKPNAMPFYNDKIRVLKVGDVHQGLIIW